MDAKLEQLDPEQFPFTEAELRAALALAERHSELRQLADDIVRGIRDERESRHRAADALARGARDPLEINPEIYLYPSEMIALLAELSPDLERRVAQWRLHQRQQSRPRRRRHAMFQAGLDPRSAPPAAIEAQLTAEDELQEQEWRRLREAVRTTWLRR